MTKHIKTLKREGITLWLNLALLGLAVCLVFYYVLLADRIAFKNYKAQTLQDKIESLAETNSSLMSKKMALDTPDSIMAFAQARGLVEAKNIAYIFEKKNVAKK